MNVFLDKIDRKILFELDRNARIADTTLAKMVGRSKESVRYRITQLQLRGVILGFTLWIDPTKLGFSSAKIYLSLANKPELRKKFIEYVTQDKRLFWLGIAEGAWNAGLTYFVQTNREFFELKNELFSRFKDLILESRTAVLVNVNIHDKTFLVPQEVSWKTMFEGREEYVLEEIEQEILRELFQDGRVSVVEMARRIGVSVDVVRHRMKRLEEKRIILKYTARIDVNALGYEFYKTFLYFRNLTKQDEQRLMQYTLQEPNIIHLVKQISPWDVELEIMCENYVDYNKIIERLTREFSGVIMKVETAIISEDYVFPAQKMIFE